MARPVEVEIKGDSKSLERAFERASRAAQRFDSNIRETGKSVRDVFGRRVATIARVGVGAVAVTTAFEAAAGASKSLSGESSSLAKGFENMSGAIRSLISLDVGGFLERTDAGAKESQSTFEKYAKELE